MDNIPDDILNKMTDKEIEQYIDESYSDIYLSSLESMEQLE